MGAVYNTCDLPLRVLEVPVGGRSCLVDTNSRTSSGSASPRSFLTPHTKTAVAGLGRIIDASSTGSCGASTPAPPGATSPSVTALGRRSTVASGAGVRTAPGLGFSRTCWTTLSARAASVTTYGWSMPPSFAPPAPRAGRKKKPASIPPLGGPRSAQLKEPPEHALGYSRGGFSTKVHFLVTDPGVVLGLYVTPRQ